MLPGFTPDPQLLSLMNQVQTGTNQEAIDATMKIKERWINSGLKEAEGTFITGELDWALQTLSSNKLALPQLTEHVRARVMQVATMITVSQTDIFNSIGQPSSSQIKDLANLGNLNIGQLDTELEKIFAPAPKNKFK